MNSLESCNSGSTMGESTSTPLTGSPDHRRPDGTEYGSGTEREFELMLSARKDSGGTRPALLAYMSLSITMTLFGMPSSARTARTQSAHKTADLWDTATSNRRFTFQHDHIVWDVVFIPDVARVLTAWEDKAGSVAAARSWPRLVPHRRRAPALLPSADAARAPPPNAPAASPVRLTPLPDAGSPE